MYACISVATVSLQQEGYQVDERGGTVDICVSLNVMADFTVHAIARTSALSATGRFQLYILMAYTDQALNYIATLQGMLTIWKL